MEGPRAPHAGEWPQVLEFLNTHLRPDAKWSIASEYPTALSPNNIGNIRVITKDNQVLSHAVLKPLIIKSPTTIFKASAIGSVVTDQNHRNQGLSQKILEECIKESERQACDFAILWTNLYDFYRKLDFELAGHEESFIINEEFTVPSAGLKFMTSTQISPESIQRLYSQHTVGSVRTTEDVRKFLSIPQTVAHTAWDVTGQLVAYAVEGKGADLTNYIHEWGGKVSSLLALLSHIRKEKKAPITLISPAHSMNLNMALDKIPGVIHNEGFLGMVRIINDEQLLAKVRKSAHTVGIKDFVLEKTSSGYLFGIGNDTAVITDKKDLVRLIFGPFPEIPELKAETKILLEKTLPVHLWIWGWDSI